MKKEIAVAFSNGQFDRCYQYLAEDIEWIIFGENQFRGKDYVIKHCEKVAQYFQSVETHFETFHVIENGTVIGINGKAEFRSEQKKIPVVNSCDIFEFDVKGLIKSIKSYC